MQTLPHRHLIGVLGGMGPAATVDFLAKIVARTPAGCDQDHVPLIIHDVPQIPDRSAALTQGSDAPFLPMLAGCRLLERAGVDAIAIPCNTAHAWHDRLARACAPRFLHIVDAVGAALAEHFPHARQPALMATRGTIAQGLYPQRLGRPVLIPDTTTQTAIDHAIAAVKGGRTGDATLAARLAARILLDQGADVLLLACTELPVALAGDPLMDHAIDSTDALAAACVALSLSSHPGETQAWTYAGCKIS